MSYDRLKRLGVREDHVLGLLSFLANSESIKFSSDTQANNYINLVRDIFYLSPRIREYNSDQVILRVLFHGGELVPSRPNFAIPYLGNGGDPVSIFSHLCQKVYRRDPSFVDVVRRTAQPNCTVVLHGITGRGVGISLKDRRRGACEDWVSQYMARQITGPCHRCITTIPDWRVCPHTDLALVRSLAMLYDLDLSIVSGSPVFDPQLLAYLVQDVLVGEPKFTELVKTLSHVIDPYCQCVICSLVYGCSRRPVAGVLASWGSSVLQDFVDRDDLYEGDIDAEEAYE